MRVVIPFLLMMLCGPLGAAPSQPEGASLRVFGEGGKSMVSHGEHFDSASTQSSWGAGFDVTAGGPWFFRSGARFARRGGTLTGAEKGMLTFEIDHLVLPIIFGRRIAVGGSTLRLGGGPAVAVPVNSDMELDNMDVWALFEAGVTIPVSESIGVSIEGYGEIAASSFERAGVRPDDRVYADGSKHRSAGVRVGLELALP